MRYVLVHVYHILIASIRIRACVSLGYRKKEEVKIYFGLVTRILDLLYQYYWLHGCESRTRCIVIYYEKYQLSSSFGPGFFFCRLWPPALVDVIASLSYMRMPFLFLQWDVLCVYFMNVFISLYSYAASALCPSSNSMNVIDRSILDYLFAHVIIRSWMWRPRILRSLRSMKAYFNFLHLWPNMLCHLHHTAVSTAYGWLGPISGSQSAISCTRWGMWRRVKGNTFCVAVTLSTNCTEDISVYVMWPILSRRP